MTTYQKVIYLPHIVYGTPMDDIVNILENVFQLGEVGKLEIFVNKNSEMKDYTSYSCNAYFNVWNDDSYTNSCSRTLSADENSFQKLYLPVNSSSIETLPYWTVYHGKGLSMKNKSCDIWLRDEPETNWV
jgi:hypothetical protein